jgi:hypothetical protein
LTQSSNPLSAYYVKGTVRGMTFNYSTNDPFYQNTVFGDTTSKVFNGVRIKGTMFTIGDESGYIPIWFYLESQTMTTHDFVTNMYVNQKFQMGTNLGINSYGYPDNLFTTVLQVNYNNQYGQQYRDFNCCTPTNQGTLIITDIKQFDTYVNVTLEFKGPLFSTPQSGDVLFFGDADIEMCVRINY